MPSEQTAKSPSDAVTSKTGEANQVNHKGFTQMNNTNAPSIGEDTPVLQWDQLVIGDSSPVQEGPWTMQPVAVKWRGDRASGGYVIRETEVEALSHAGLGIIQVSDYAPDFDGYSLTHMNSGYKLCSVSEIAQGIQIAEILIESGIDWKRRSRESIQADADAIRPVLKDAIAQVSASQ